MENLSRRSFLALGTLGAASAAAAGLAGCAPQTKGSASTDLATTGNRSSEPINSSGIEVNPDEVVEVIETNIVIVGGGLSGLAAAVQAAENGDDFILLEAQATLGGNGQGVEGTFAVDSRFQKEQNIQVDRSIIMQEELGKTQWVADGLLYKDLCDNSAANIEWLVDQCGCELEGTIDNYPFGVSVGSVDTFHWWKDGAAYVGYVMPMQQKLRDAAAVARELAAYSPHSAYMGGIGNAMERISMPSGGRRAYLSAQAGCAAAAMAKSPSNGDAMAIRRVGHELLLILSDGMGSGVAAHRESQCAVAMYGELISIGFGEEDAVRSINELLYSKNTDELYATLDAIRIDLSTGEATILKQSAPPAFLIRNGRIRPLYAEAPPLGILKEASVGIRKTRLNAGDTLVLMTDGLSDALGSGLYAAMQDAVLHAETPESAARTLIARAGGVSARDDMSAIVARFSSCHKNAQF